LKSLLDSDPLAWNDAGQASLHARQEFIRERLRLFFVGITRARRWLTITHNTGRTSVRNVPARAFLELVNYWEKRP
jgi:DNA helicase-2/ATP-dependent DNA helicase PcrA